MKKVAFHNLGCKVNAYETAAMEQLLNKAGYEIVSFDEPFDIAIINTCSVTNMADRKSRQMIHKAKKLNPNATVVAAGCYVQTKADEASSDNAVDIIVGNNEKKNIVEILKILQANNIIDINETKEYEEMGTLPVTEHTRAHIKIQDGCNNFCSYCIIPYARGRVRSRDIENIVSEARELVNKGYKEIVITGIEVSSYDYEGKTLIDVIERLDKIDGLERIRLSSLNPDMISEDFVVRLSKLEKICPHFHLSMQSGCDKILKSMNRHYTSDEYLEKCELLRTYFDNPSITTDIIVGFPGETDEDYEITYEFVKKANLYQIHVFKYSRRDGTVAASMPDQVDDRVKAERSDKLIKLGEELQTKQEKNMIGSVSEVLFEEKTLVDGAEYYIGHTKNYVTVAVSSNEALDGEIRSVKFENLVNNHIILATL